MSDKTSGTHTGDMLRMPEIIQQHLADCYSAALRVLGDRDAAEQAVVNAASEPGRVVSGSFSGEYSMREFAVKKTLRACIDVEESDEHQRTPRHIERANASDGNARFIAGFSALPITARVIVELNDLQQISGSEIAEMLNIEEQEMRETLNSSRQFLSRYFELAEDGQPAG